MTKSVLSLTDVSVGYRRHFVARGLTGVLSEGTLVALVGRNGAGKSTLLRTLAGFQPPLGGEIAWAGEPLRTFSPQRLARRLAVVLTERPDTGNLTAREVVEMGRTPYTPFSGRLSAHDRTRVDESLEQAGVAPLAARRLTSLSDGERQRVMIAKALAQDTPVILLDEPTAFLDFAGKTGILRLLRQLAREQGKTILLSTHDLELAFQLSDRLWLLSADGLTQGAPRDLAATGELARFFAQDGLTFDAATLRFILN